MTTILFSSEDQGVLSSNRGAYRCRAIYMHINLQAPVFVLNHTKTLDGDNWPRDNLAEVQQATRQLVATQGGYFTLHGRCRCPFTFLSWMQGEGYTFDQDCRQQKIDHNRSGFVDVRGNLRQVSSAFCYRFYDQALLAQWRQAAVEIDPACQAVDSAA